MTDLSIIILNWNTRDDLHCCLESIEKEIRSSFVAPDHPASSAREAIDAGSPVIGRPAGSPTVETIVVDNASVDGSPEMVKERFPWARLIVNPANLGFSAGNNRGIESSTARLVLLLNPDTVVHPGALRALVNFAASRPDAGIIGARLLNRDGTIQYSCRAFPTLATGFFRDTPLGRLFPGNRYNRDYLLTDWDHGTPREIDWVSGAAMLIRREVMDQIGLLDESFFMYCEDVDYCFRARQAGWKTVFCPAAVITHRIAGASDQNVGPMMIARHRSMYHFFRKHYASANPLVWPLVIGGLTTRCGALLLKNRIDRWRQSRQDRRLIRGDNGPDTVKEPDRRGGHDDAPGGG